MSVPVLDTTLVPALGEPRPQPVPEAHDTTLPSGLRLVVVPRPGVPLVELRLRVPFAAASARAAAAHVARSAVLAGAVLLGTARHDQVEIAQLLQAQGAELGVSVDPDRLTFSTTLLPSGLAPVLGVLAELLTAATYPAGPVEGERARVAERIAIARSQPGVIARSALASRRYGLHPYGQQLPRTELVGSVSSAALRKLHRERVLPAGSTLVLVGDLDPAAALDAVGAALGGWTATGTDVPVLAVPQPVPGPLELVDRPGAVQSNIRLGGPAPARTDPELPAVRLAAMVFGGYFSSRLVENIRERKGYSYSPRSAIDHLAGGASFLVEADVATEVTGPALLETTYELGRMALTTVTEAELDAARRYVLGTTALATATHAGLASTLSALLGAGLQPGWLAEHQRALGAVTVEEVTQAARRWFAPARLTGVVVGDAGRVADALHVLGPVQVTATAEPEPGA
ncbi:insulinase family protein [Modestobacter sp. I12A-02628]|uniref:Insulinase family protein n=1 Tax=Goekera deserti TaxID=2497753 RepID=A0A7K3W7S6_9ACTN|nr:pitrilysin family protein [Goekera deserti]MPQ99850.1 insulinase family protein [Goekera deserti]NDI50008.1 insulinase family protein [Goekera deserti]NEL52515.1 insulinase family protein [Goekera deserti]